MSGQSAVSADRQAFYDEIQPFNMTPLWEVLHALVPKSPATRAVPVRWRYDEVRPFLMRSGELISAKEAERRVLILENPGCAGESAATGTLYAGLQLILPGEVAPCHRHTQSALRFVMEGAGAYTAVDGERAVMREFDLILTPSWQWHDHGNAPEHMPSDAEPAPMVWLDGLDIPTLRFFDAGFAEQGNSDYQLDRRPPGFSQAMFGRNMLPVGYQAPKTSPVFHYPYAEYRDALERMKTDAAWDPHQGLKLEFINPATGGPMMSTISGFVQLLPKGFRSEPYRATDAMVVTVVEGTGTAQIGRERFDLKSRDVFVVPSWHRLELDAAEDLTLFVFSDKGMQQALGIWREERMAR
jgi:gentisate 1,2-dioxygenase